MCRTDRRGLRTRHPHSPDTDRRSPASTQCSDTITKRTPIHCYAWPATAGRAVAASVSCPGRGWCSKKRSISP